MESKPDSFACPSCATRLRLGPTFFAEKRVPCPECSTDLLVGHSESGIRVALFVAEIEDAVSKLPSIVSKILDSPRRAQWLAGAVTSIVALTIIVLVLTGPDDTDRVSADPMQEEKHAPSQLGTGTTVALDKTDATKLPDDSVIDSPKTPANQNTDASADRNETVGVVPAAPQPNLLNERPDNVTELPSTQIKQVVNTENANEPDTQVKPASIDVPAKPNVGPGPVPPVDSQVVGPVVTGPTDDVPLVEKPPIAPPVEPPKTLVERLAQPLRSFKQATPVPLSAIVEIVEELVQARITFEVSVTPALQTLVVLSLEKTTPQELLEQAVVRAKLKVVVTDDAIRLEPLK